MPSELLRPAPVDQVKRIEMQNKAEAAERQKPEWLEKQLQSVQLDTGNIQEEDQNGKKLQESIKNLQSIPKRREEFSRLI